ncbi:hypothetical protein ACHWQZ_G003774 [Mnemiopsis leidyi]
MSEEDSWIYDSVVGFLNSPIWMVPIESFVDQHCLVFDGTTQDTSEYYEIHTQYKVLVEELLESFTNDLHITSGQFIEGCQKGRAATSTYTQGMFEYVFASVNYELFKSIMVRHNAALSLQALQMIRGNSSEGALDLEAEVMKFSEQEFKTHRKEFDEHTVKEMADLEAALMKSRLDCETLLKDIEKDKAVLGENMETKRSEVMAPTAPLLYPEIPQFSIQSPRPTAEEKEAPPVPPNTSASQEESKTSADTVDSLPPLRTAPVVQPSNDAAAQKWMEEAKAESSPTSSAPRQAPTEQTLEERRLYWQRRKQEIIESKRSAALQTLSAHGESSGRPKSARVAQRAVQQDLAAAPSVAPQEAKPAMSQALAAALRREVVHR